ncbi:MAG: tetratricopeptide repeat protein [Planctomycetota bacterium]|nr:tetratricopeptide repeat protein [Planctomycetota bacterium]
MNKQSRPSTRVDDAGSEFHSQFTHLEYQFGQLFSSRPLISPHARYVFETKEKLGEGGMGTVYRVRDHRLGRDAALKMINKGLDDENMTRRFLREAEITARLVHPAIPPVHEAGLTVEGQLYMLMRVIEGKTLAERVNESSSLQDDRRDLIEVLIRVAEAVAYAHTQGIIHRDLKPDNVMIGDFGEVMVMDWGIAKDLNAESATSFEQLLDTNRLDQAEMHSAGLTLTGAIIGTPGYMSPEQLESVDIDGQADVYSLGLMLSEILTGEPAITGQNTLEIIAATLTDSRTAPRTLDASIPKELNWIAIQATKLDPKSRTINSKHFVDQLKCYLVGELVPDYPYTSFDKIQRSIKRHPAFLLGLTMTLVFSTVAALLWAQLEQEKQRVLAVQAKNAAAERDALIAENVLRESQKKTKLAEDKAQSAKRVLVLVNEARTMVQRGAPLAGIRATLRKALDSGDRSVELLLNCAQILEESGDFDYATVLLEEVTKKSSPAYQALFQLHHIELKKRGIDFATTKALRRIVKLAEEGGDENEFSLFAKANKLAAKGKLKEALDCLNRVEKYTLTSAWTYSQRGLYKSDLGRKNEALKDYKRALEIDPKLSIAYYNRAGTLSSLGDKRGSLEDYNKAIKFRPRFAQAFVNRGILMRSLKRYDEALEDFSYAIQANSKLPQAYFNRGMLYYLKKDNKRAMSDLSEAIKFKSRYSKAYHSRGIIKNESGDQEGAFEDYCLAIRHNPKNTLALYSRALIYSKRGKHQESIDDCKAAIKVDPRYGSPYVQIGQVLATMGKTDDAIDQLNKALKVDPKNSYAYFSRARCWKKKGQLKKAFDDYTKTIQYNRRFAEAFVNRGILLKANKQWKEALADFTAAMKAKPSLPQAYINRAYLYEQLKQYEKALKDWRSYRKLARSSKDKKYCDDQIKRLTQKLRSP